MDKYIVLLELTGHCGAQNAYLVDVLDYDEENLRKAEEWHTRKEEECNYGDPCPYCGMLEGRQWGRPKVVIFELEEDEDFRQAIQNLLKFYEY